MMEGSFFRDFTIFISLSIFYRFCLLAIFFLSLKDFYRKSFCTLLMLALASWFFLMLMSREELR